MLVPVVLMGLMSIESHAQSNWEAGLRAGENFGFDVTIPLSAAPRLHLATYFLSDFDYDHRYHNDNFGLGAYFDWMFALEGGPTGLKFYPGVGPEMYFGDDFNIGVAGNFGAEYTFDFPLTVGLDWRPGVIFTNDIGFQGNNIGAIARFRFGEGINFKRTR